MLVNAPRSINPTAATVQVLLDAFPLNAAILDESGAII
jgi:hypothetical protein